MYFLMLALPFDSAGLRRELGASTVCYRCQPQDWTAGLAKVRTSWPVHSSVHPVQLPDAGLCVPQIKSPDFLGLMEAGHSLVPIDGQSHRKS